MKKLILLLGVIFLISCRLAPDAPKYEEQSQQDLINGMTYTVVVIDGCEYILGAYNSFHGGYVLTHKGNCKNPIHHNDRKLFK